MVRKVIQKLNLVYSEVLKNIIVRKIEKKQDNVKKNQKILNKSNYINMLKKDYKCYYYIKKKHN